MKLIIDIPEEDYKGICHLRNEQLRMLPVEVAETLIRIANGIPLPKGHGRLIDADKFQKDHYLEKRYGYDFYREFQSRLKNQLTVVEADKESE